MEPTLELLYERYMDTLKAEGAAKDSILAALRASHDEIQDVALRALRGDFERRTDR